MLDIIVTTRNIPDRETLIRSAKAIENFTRKRVLGLYVNRKKREIIYRIENPILLPLLGMLPSILIPLGLLVVGVKIGGGIAESLKKTAWVWVPIVAGIGAVLLILMLRPKIEEITKKA